MARTAFSPAMFLAGVPLFAALDAPTLARLAAAATRRTLQRGETLFRQGDAPTGLYVVVYGEIKLLTTTPSRGARLSGVVGARQSFGEAVMFLERPAVVEAQAASDALVLHVPKEAVFAELERNPTFARRLIAGLSQRIERLVQELALQSLGSGTERIVAYLLRHAGRPGEPLDVSLPASKAAIATQLNLTPEHFSRILHELQDAGLLTVQGRRITVPHPERLPGAAAARKLAAAPNDKSR